MQNRTFLSLAAIIVASTAVSSAGNWKSQWIAPTEKAGPNKWLCFRKTIEIDEVPSAAGIDVSCDSKYWLWINDELVIFEGQLKRGPTPDSTYFDHLDIAPHLRKGKNTFAFLVWYWGRDGFSHNDSGRAALIVDSLDGSIRLGTDRSWKVIVHPAYGSTAEPHPNFRLPEHNIQFDARKDIPGWYRSDFDDSSWPAAAELGRPPASPWNQLELRPIPQWKNSGLKAFTHQRVVNNADSSKTIIGTLPYNAQVTPYIKVKAAAGKKIDLRTDNYMGGSAPSIRSVYITREGVQEFEAFAWFNGHDIRCTLPVDVELVDFKYRQTGYDADFVGSFTCDDESLNTLWKKSGRTLYITMRDTYMDCPDRERAQWWGDAVNELGEAFYVFDYDRGPLLARKGIYELARWQRGDKSLYSPVPSGRAGKYTPSERASHKGIWNSELPRQMLASVGHYGFWTYYLYSGDKQTIIDVYPHVRDYLALWKLGEDGLAVHRTGQWDWTDWGDNKDVAVVENAWLVLAFDAAINMAQLTGNDRDVSEYAGKIASIRANFNRTFWQGDCYRSPGYTGDTDDRANAMAVVAGLAEDDYFPALKKVFKTQFHASPYMEKYVLEALCMMNCADEAVKRMKDRWQKQIASPLTTLWEGWGIGGNGFGGGTYNHAWSGGPLTIMSQYLAGIGPALPGYEKARVLPQPGPLKKIRCVVPVPQGKIGLDIANDPELFVMKLVCPVPVVIGVPIEHRHRTIYIDGLKVYEKGKPLTGKKVAAFIAADDRHIRFALPRGSHRVQAK